MGELKNARKKTILQVKRCQTSAQLSVAIWKENMLEKRRLFLYMRRKNCSVSFSFEEWKISWEENGLNTKATKNGNRQENSSLRKTFCRIHFEEGNANHFEMGDKCNSYQLYTHWPLQRGLNRFQESNHLGRHPRLEMFCQMRRENLTINVSLDHSIKLMLLNIVQLNIKLEKMNLLFISIR